LQAPIPHHDEADFNLTSPQKSPKLCQGFSIQTANHHQVKILSQSFPLNNTMANGHRNYDLEGNQDCYKDAEADLDDIEKWPIPVCHLCKKFYNQHMIVIILLGLILLLVLNFALYIHIFYMAHLNGHSFWWTMRKTQAVKIFSFVQDKFVFWKFFLSYIKIISEF